MTDSLTDSLTLVDLTDFLPIRRKFAVTNSLTDWLTDSLADWLTDTLADWFTDLLTKYIFNLLGKNYHPKKNTFSSLNWFLTY